MKVTIYDESNYSDRATLEGDIRWVVVGNDMTPRPAR